MGKNLSKAVKIVLLREIALAGVFHFRQASVSCRLIDKIVMEYFY